MFSIVKLYRLGNDFYRRKIPFIPYCIKWFIRRYYSADIPFELEIGENFHLGHAGLGVIIHPRCIIGNNVTIGQHVTLGGNKGSIGVPMIKNNVYIGPGAKILGNIVIGNNVIIGANSVVLASVADDVVAAGIPAKIIRKVTDKDIYINKNLNE